MDTAAAMDLGYSTGQLAGLAQLDPGLDDRDFAEVGDRLDRIDDQDFAHYLDRPMPHGCRERFAGWPRT